MGTQSCCTAAVAHQIATSRLLCLALLNSFAAHYVVLPWQMDTEARTSNDDSSYST